MRSMPKKSVISQYDGSRFRRSAWHAGAVLRVSREMSLDPWRAIVFPWLIQLLGDAASVLFRRTAIPRKWPEEETTALPMVPTMLPSALTATKTVMDKTMK